MVANEIKLKSYSSLIKEIKARDMSAIFAWLENNKSKYYKIGWAFLRNAHDVQDVLHNTIIKVYENIEQLNNVMFFDSWVTSIFINECRRIYRQRKRLAYVQIEQLSPSADCLDHLIVLEGLEKIEDIYKEVVILKYIGDYTHEEISQMLDIPIGTVKTRIYRGLRMLREEMSEGGE